MDVQRPSVRDRREQETGSSAAEEFLQRHRWLVQVARVSWAAKGAVYLLTGLLAFLVAATPFDGGSTSDEQADPSGAIATVAEQPFGTALLWLMAVGLFVYMLWRVVTVLVPSANDLRSIARRAGFAVSALASGALAVTAASVARRSGSSPGGQSQDERVTSVTAEVLGWTAGRWLVGLAGVALVAVGVGFLVKAWTGSFDKELERRSLGPLSWRAVRVLGRAGWSGRGAMTALIGVFVTMAAIQFDPDDARGLDDSLRRVADHPVGVVFVGVVAIGLVFYGVFCILTVPIRQLVAADGEPIAP